MAPQSIKSISSYFLLVLYIMEAFVLATLFTWVIFGLILLIPTAGFSVLFLLIGLAAIFIAPFGALPIILVSAFIVLRMMRKGVAGSESYVYAGMMVAAVCSPLLILIRDPGTPIYPVLIECLTTGALTGWFLSKRTINNSVRLRKILKENS